MFLIIFMQCFLALADGGFDQTRLTCLFYISPDAVWALISCFYFP